MLDNNAINQLNLISQPGQRKKKTSSVLDIITNTSTHMGKRLLKSRLLNPELNTREINRRLDHTQQMLQPVPKKITTSLLKNTSDQLWYQVIEQYLREIQDLEKLHRKIETNNIQPCEFATALTSYQRIQELLNLVSQSKFNTLIPEGLVEDFTEYLNSCRQIKQEVAAKYNLDQIEENFFNSEYSEILSNHGI